MAAFGLSEDDYDDAIRIANDDMDIRVVIVTGSGAKAFVAGADITFAMLADPEAARVVCFGKDGVLAGTGPGHDYIDLSTVDDDTSRTIAAAVAFIEQAPIGDETRAKVCHLNAERLLAL